MWGLFILQTVYSKYVFGEHSPCIIPFIRMLKLEERRMGDLHNHEEEHDDDKPIGYLLSRREVLKLLGGSSAAIVAGFALPKLVIAQETPTPSLTDTPTCVVRPELTEGPYFVENELNRFDLRFDPADESLIKSGLPLLLRFRISDVTDAACVPLADAQVDVWHCDAEGMYSGVEDVNFDTTESMWLRGYQLSDEFGIAEFMTIVPGWYSGRAVHIHFKIRTELEDSESYEFTSQFFFDPDLIEELYTEEPYAEKGLPDTPNEADNIFQGSNGQLTLDLIVMTDDELEVLNEREELSGSVIEAGYVATFDVGLDLSDLAIGASDSGGFGSGRPGGRP